MQVVKPTDADGFGGDASGTSLPAVYSWDVHRPRAVMLIVHGLAEHAGRYAEFARHLNQQRIGVIAYDQRGHGLAAADRGILGFAAARDGWELLLQDLAAMQAWVQTQYGDLPLFILGHSMGSFLVRCHLANAETAGCRGAIISATGPDPGIAGRIGLAVAALRCTIGKPDSPSPLLDRLTFGAFARPFKPLRTRFDWLSRDQQEVDAYIQDEYCGQISTASLYRDLLHGVIAANASHSIHRAAAKLPLLFIAGDRDPVGQFGKGFTKVAAGYSRVADSRVTVQLYPGGRHEMLHEENRSEVFAQIVKWVYSIIS